MVIVVNCTNDFVKDFVPGMFIMFTLHRKHIFSEDLTPLSISGPSKCSSTGHHIVHSDANEAEWYPIPTDPLHSPRTR